MIYGPVSYFGLLNDDHSTRVTPITNRKDTDVMNTTHDTHDTHDSMIEAILSIADNMKQPSRIEVEHNGLVIEWLLENSEIADEVIRLLAARVLVSHAVPTESQDDENPISLIPTEMSLPSAATQQPKTKKKDFKARRPRTAITPELLKKVAEVYLMAGEGQKTRAVRDLLGPGTSSGLASGYISKARQAGFLPEVEHQEQES